MFGKISLCVVVLSFVLLAAGCGASLGVESDIEPTKTLVLDDEFESTVSLERGDVLGLDMRLPGKSGYKVVGASFDPSLFRLDHFLEYKADGESRAQYLFALLADGASDILIKMQPLAGGDVEIFKRVSVTIGEDDGLF